jgi:hypothetical protein
MCSPILNIEMERLWIELGGEALDPIALNACPTRTVRLADGKVLEISGDHLTSHQQGGIAPPPNHLIPPIVSPENRQRYLGNTVRRMDGTAFFDVRIAISPP